MTIEEFWNQAFLAALGRLPVNRAKKEADAATRACIEHWHANRFNWSPENPPLLQDLNIAKSCKPADARGNAILGSFALETTIRPTNSIKKNRREPAVKKASQAS